MKKASDIMTSHPAYALPEDRLGEIAKLMCDRDCGEIPIVENEETLRPVGVVTDRDIACRAVAEGKNPLDMSAAECMSRPCVTVDSGADIEECLALLNQHQIRRLPVVDEKGALCGMVAQADIARTAPQRQTAELVKEVSKEAA
jgi:CBS domain-containing protein